MEEARDMTKSVRISFIGALIVWALGFAFAIVEIFVGLHERIKTTDGRVISYVALILVLTAAAVHQLLIYHSIHEMDTVPAEYEKEFGTWIGAATEKCLRGLTVALLLCVGGEIPLLGEYMTRQFSGHPLAARNIGWAFPVASRCLCLGLLAWDLAAWRHARAQGKPSKVFPQGISPSSWSLRQWFFVSDLSCVTIWLLICAIYFSDVTVTFRGAKWGVSAPDTVGFLIFLALLYALIIFGRGGLYLRRRAAAETQELTAEGARVE
jgi:hypothetical protein